MELTWVKIYFNDKAQKVVIKVAYSTWKLVASGILEEHLQQHSEGGNELIFHSMCAGDTKTG